MTKSEIEPLTKEEMNALIDASVENDFFYMLFNVAKTTGRRLGELYGTQKYEEIGRRIIGRKLEKNERGEIVPLAKTRGIYKKIPGAWEYGVQVKDINFREGIMKVWVLKRKRYQQDDTLLTPEVMKIINHYIIKNQMKAEDYLFREKSYRQIEYMTKKFAERAGINKKIVFHNFRHYFITELVRQGWSHTKIAKLTGHKSLGTLQIYDHVLSKDIKDDALRAVRDI